MLVEYLWAFVLILLVPHPPCESGRLVGELALQIHDANLSYALRYLALFPSIHKSTRLATIEKTDTRAAVIAIAVKMEPAVLDLSANGFREVANALKATRNTIHF
jgi:hypothetical protein